MYFGNGVASSWRITAIASSLHRFIASSLLRFFASGRGDIGSFVRFGLATLLLLAGILKAEQYATQPSLSFFEVANVLIEVLLSAWLVLGFFPVASWCATTACFGVFMTVVLSKAIRGESTCGCFGAIQTPTWIAVLIDGLAILALLAWATNSVSAPTIWTMRRRLRSASSAPYALVALVVLFVGYRSAALIAGGQTSVNEAAARAAPVNAADLRRMFAVELDSGEWDIALLNQSCPRCHDWLRRQADDGPLFRVMLVQDLVRFYSDASRTSSASFIEPFIDDARDVSRVPTPATIRLQAGKVTGFVSLSLSEGG